MKYTIVSACQLKFIMSWLLLTELSGVVNAANIAVVPKVGPGATATAGAGKQWPTIRFVLDPSGNCITDNLTGLMWAKNANLFTSAVFWADAKDKVAQMNTTSGATGYNLCGYTDWRLPNLVELTSLVNYASSKPNEWLMYGSGSAATPDCAGACFSNVQASVYWSSTTYAPSTGDAWFVNMSDGRLGSGLKATGYRYVWPVRGGK